MLKLAVVGAQTLLGRELVGALEARDCSVVPLATGVLTAEEEEGDLVVFAPVPALLEGLDAVILADTPQSEELLDGFPGRLLDLRDTPEPRLDPIPLLGPWPEGGSRALRGRPAIEQILMLLPQLVTGLGDVAGTHLRSVACLGDRGIDGLMDQTVALLKGEEPNTTELGYRAAFEVVPQVARGRFVEVRVPVFHGDLLVLHLRAPEGGRLGVREAPEGCKWVPTPPSSREVAINSDLLAHFAPSADGLTAVLTLGFDPILWGALRPTLRVFGL
jgi:hypothetical protein